MTTNPFLGELREADLAELDWLAAQDDDGFLGYAPLVPNEALGWSAETWVLHGMWEDPAAGRPCAVPPRTVEQRWRDEHPGQDAIGILAYESTPFSQPPPAGWRRLTWRELTRRHHRPPAATPAASTASPPPSPPTAASEPTESLVAGEFRGEPVPPCFRWFPTGSWPETIQTPPEGTLDPVSGQRLLDVLAAHTPGGMAAPCFCFYDVLDSPARMQRLVLAGPLAAVFDAARYNRPGTTPDNIWPADRSWLLWTHQDLWGTRLIGSGSVVAAVEADTELETVAFAYRPRPLRDSTREVRR